MGLGSFLKKKIKKGVGAAEDVATSAADVAARAPSAVAGYAGRLKTNVEADLANPNSEGYKFAHSPAGQYYLPSAAQKVLGFVLPTPQETVNSNKQFIQNPGLKTGLRAGLTDLSIVSAPAMVTGAAALPGATRKGAAMIAERGLGRTLASESGARVLGGIAKKAVPKTAEDVATTGAKLQAAKSVTGVAARTERIGAKITGERVASVGLADEAADVQAAARLQKIPTAILRESKTHSAKLELVRRLESTPGAKGGLTRSVTSPEAIAKAGIQPAKAPRSRIAGAVSTANRPGQGGLKAASTEASVIETAAPAIKTTMPSEVVQHVNSSVWQKMNDATLAKYADTAGGKAEMARRAGAATTPKPAFGAGAKPGGPVSAKEAISLNATKPAVAETVSTAPKGGGLGMPSQAAKEATVAEVKAAAPKAKTAPKGSNPNYTQKSSKVTTSKITSEDLSKLPGGVKGIQTAKPVSAAEGAAFDARMKAAEATSKRGPGGSTKGAPRGAAVKRAPGADFEAALAAAGEKPSGSIAAKAVKAKVSETGIHPGTGKPVKLTSRGTIDKTPNTPTGKKTRSGRPTEVTPEGNIVAGKKPPGGSGSKGRGPQPTKAPMSGRGVGSSGVGGSSGGLGKPKSLGEVFGPPASLAAKTAQRGLASKVIGTATAPVRDILKSRAGKVAVGTGIVAGAFTLGSSRGGSSTPPEVTGGGTTSTAQTIDEAIAGMTDSETKTSMIALRAVQKKGEAEGYDALAALREGLGSAQASPDFPTQAELQHPQTSARYAQQYKDLQKPNAIGTRGAKTPAEAQGVLLETVGKKRDQLLRESVQRAVDMAKQRAKNEAQRKKNR